MVDLLEPVDGSLNFHKEIKMIKNEMSIIFQRPVQEVFDFMSDFQNGPQWQTGLLGVGRITEGAIGSLVAAATQPQVWAWIHSILASF